MDQINAAPDNNSLEHERAWKLWLFIPRMLPHRPRNADRVPKPQLLERFSSFFEGNWQQLLAASAASSQRTHTPQPAANHPTANRPTPDQRTNRATQLARLGELSRAWQALLAAPMAPGNGETLRALTSPTARPQQPHQPLDPAILQFSPGSPVQLPPQLIRHNLAKARKGTAPGPSGLTAEIAKVLLDDPIAAEAFQRVCLRLANATIPSTIAAAIGLGRMIALQKPSGGVRGLVVGDFLRRLVARSLAQHYASDFDAKCHPFQYALSTRADTEALIHTLQLTTELDPSQTILSVDGIGAYDHVSRASMLQGLRHTPHAQDALPFVRLFYSQPSTYLWVDDSGHVHRITQADGGEQGDPLMPALFSLGAGLCLACLSNRIGGRGARRRLP